jgi:hypothetical protein
VEIKLDSRFQKKVKGLFGKYEFEVGVLDDKPYRKPQRGQRGQRGQDVLTQYAGMQIRKASRIDSGVSISEVSASFRKHLGFNYLIEAFKDNGKIRNNSEILKFSNEFMKLVFGRSEKRRTENLIQAIVRNPFKRKEFGDNSPLTKTIKGFSHKGIDTAQLFKNIKARCIVK